MLSPTNTDPYWDRFLRFDLPVLAYAGLIFWMSSRSLGAKEERWLDLISDDLPHAIEYGLLTFLIFRSLWGSWRIRKLGVLILLTFLLSMGYALLDEWHQSFVPTRAMDPQDLISDGVGTLVTLALSAGYLLKKKKLTL